MQIARQKRNSMRMEMTPLIDCVFLLLIFFMLSSTFLTPSIELTLPTANAEQVAENEPLLITIDKQGGVFLNAEGVSLESLGPRLRELLAESEEKSVTVRGDKDMKYDYFVQVLEIAKSNGAAQVNIAHEFPKSQ